MRLVLSLACLTLSVLGLPAPASAEMPATTELAHVVAVEGRVTAAAPGEAGRVLACGDAVHADERIVTARGARVVVAREGRHLHLAPDALAILRRAAAGELLAVLVRGDLRVLDTADRPAIRVATPLGAMRFEGADLEIHRFASGALQVCDWSRTSPGTCRSMEPSGRMRMEAQEGPRVDLALDDVCEDVPRWAAFSPLDFASPPAVAAGPAAPFDVEPELEPACGGDECNGRVPDVELPTEIEYTIAQPPPFIPPFP